MKYRRGRSVRHPSPDYFAAPLQVRRDFRDLVETGASHLELNSSMIQLAGLPAGSGRKFLTRQPQHSGWSFSAPFNRALSSASSHIQGS